MSTFEIQITVVAALAALSIFCFLTGSKKEQTEEERIRSLFEREASRPRKNKTGDKKLDAWLDKECAKHARKPKRYEEPSFIFPELLEKYRRKYLDILRKWEQNYLIRQLVCEKIQASEKELESITGTDARSELVKRQLREIVKEETAFLKKKCYWMVVDHGRNAVVDHMSFIAHMEGKLLEELRQEENEIIAKDGYKVNRSWKAESRQEKFGLGYTSPAWWKTERRLVCVGTKYFLCQIKYEGLTKKVGQKSGTIQTDMYKPRPKEITVPILEWTSEYEKEGQIEWVTDSLDQMTKDELEAIRQDQL